MALTCPTHFDTHALRDQVRAMYRRVAQAPEGSFHFHRGPSYAAELLGYDPTELEAIPSVSTARFAGVGNPLAVGPIERGATVLDHACGAGMDLLLAARRVGPTGRAVGVDMTTEMRECARRGAQEADLNGVVDIRDGVFEHLPVSDRSIDIVLSNGVVNLAPDKRQVFAEIGRVLRPGGRLYLADVVVARELKLSAREDPELWAACVGGALTELELHELAASVGLVDARVVDRYDCFRGTSAEAKVAEDLQVGAVGFFARKP